jgi:hypothetical protein
MSDYCGPADHEQNLLETIRKQEAEIERLQAENERLRNHDFDLWLKSFEEFVAGQAHKASET